MQAERVEVTPHTCLADESIFAFVQGRLPEEAVPELEEHLGICPDCRAVLAETARFFASTATNATLDMGQHTTTGADTLVGSAAYVPLAPGTHISRYVLSGVIGSGAAGVVYRAYDPELRRDIALKLLRTSPTREPAPLKARLLREAQAMARLSHPNVVSVYDVGTFGAEIFVVLELVKGQNLAEWLDEPSRSWREVLWAFMEAGKGLAAAHDVQLVHRDFKPANVLVGSDTRVRVTDFGLARTIELDRGAPNARAEPETAASNTSLSECTPFSITMTQAGLAGTPVYMAPEQFAQQRTDERTDQFGFCVALYLALYRRHPFLDFEGPGRRYSFAELAVSVRRGAVHVPPSSEVPSAVLEILRRGLQVDPSARFPSMQELLARLGSEPVALTTRRPHARSSRWVATSLVLGIAAALVFGARAYRSSLSTRGSPPTVAMQSVGILPVAVGSAQVPLPPVQPSPSALPIASAADAVLPPRARPSKVRAAIPRAPLPAALAAPEGRKQYADALKEPF